MFKMNNKIISVILLIILIGISVYFVREMKTTNAIREAEENEKYEDWLSDNCKCLEKERIKCSEYFELIGGVCKNEEKGLFTNVLKGCSVYECSEQNVTWTGEDWEPELISDEEKQ